MKLSCPFPGTEFFLSENLTGATIVEMDVLTCGIGKAISFNFKRKEYQHASSLLLQGSLQMFNEYPLARLYGKIEAAIKLMKI